MRNADKTPRKPTVIRAGSKHGGILNGRAVKWARLLKRRTGRPVWVDLRLVEIVTGNM